MRLAYSYTEPLTPEDESAFKSFWASHMSDGWGEGFRPLETGNEKIGQLYIKFWLPDKDWSIYSEDEFQLDQTTGPVMFM